MQNTGNLWVKNVEPVGAVLQTDYRTSKLTLARFVHHSEKTTIKADTEDAVVAVMINGDMPYHECVFDGRRLSMSEGPSNGFNFADLRGDPVCEIYGPLDELHLHIPRAAFDDIADDADSPPIERLHSPMGWETEDHVLSAMRTTLLNAVTRPEETSKLFVDHMILALHAHLARAYGGLREAGRRRSGRLAPWQLRTAKELIAANLTRDLSLVEIADHCRLSVAHFSRAFKISTGVTPHGFLQLRRIDKARELMGGDLSLAEIALACGFADQSHFTRIFTRIAGVTPGAWRRHRARPDVHLVSMEAAV